MVKMLAVYQGKKHCELKHEPSGSTIETDAPKDNQGLGEAFSPTDLVGAALASCVLTTMAIAAEKNGLELKGATAHVEKTMQMTPRRIAVLRCDVTMPGHLTAAQRKDLEQVGDHCPVARSLSAETKIEMHYTYK